MAEGLQLTAEREHKLIVPGGGYSTCYSFLQDMGVILFNRSTQMICLNPQLLAKALACIVMPPEHEKLVYGGIPVDIRGLSIIPEVFTEQLTDGRLFLEADCWVAK